MNFPKKPFVGCFVAVCAAILSCCLTLQAAGMAYHPTRLIVKYKQLPSATALSDFRAILKATQIDPLMKKLATSKKFASDLDRTYLITFPDSVSRLAAEAQLASDPSIVYIERDYKLELFHDPLYHYQWGLENKGQEYPGIIRVAGNNNDTLKFLSGTAGADINRDAVSDIPTDHSRVVVAIIDTGVDYEHPDLQGNIWRNQAEAAGLPSRDDDLDGYIDDIVGYDFSGDSTDVINVIPDPVPIDNQVGHGTHVAGIVGAVTGNGIGVEGVAPNVQIMCLKIFPNAFTSVSSAAIIYAVDHGAKVINASWGSPYFSSVLSDAIHYAKENGVLFVAASGNSGDSSPFYPAALEDALTVGACNSSGKITTFSTFGDWLDLSAPGQDILSLRAKNTDLYAPGGEPGLRIIDENYILADGTSMAAPHVAGAAAFLLSYSPGLSGDSLRNILISTADKISDPSGNPQADYSIYSGFGRINLERAVGVLSGSYAEIAAPAPNAIQSGMVTIEGSALSAIGEEYLLEAYPASVENWIEIASGDANLVTTQLAKWDSSPYDGATKIRLRVGDGIAYSTTIRLVNNVVVGISSPAEGDTISAAIAIVGTASAPEFHSYDLYYYPDTTPKQPQLIKHSSVPAFSEQLVNWSIGPVRSGSGTLLLRLTTAGESTEVTVPIFIKSLLNADYPVSPATRPHVISQPADLNGDGDFELVTGGLSGVIVFDPSTREMRLLDPGIGSRYQSAPAVYDFDADGRDELVVVSDSGITVINSDGDNLPGWPHIIHTGYQFNSNPTPLVSDIDGDGDPEIAFISDAGNFYCYRSNGSAYFHSLGGLFASISSTEIPRLFAQNMPAYVFSYDFNGDGYRDIGAVYGIPGGDGGVFIYSGKNGQPLYPEIGARVLRASTPSGGILADFDNDGIPELALVHSTPDFEIVVRIIESDGSDLPGWPRRYPEKYQYFSPYPAAGDLDGDSIPELVVVFSAPLDGGELYIWHADGTPWLESELGRNDGFVAGVNNALANPLILDTDNDGAYEVVVRGGATLIGSVERLYSFELDGSQTQGWPLYTFAAPGTVLYTPNTPLAGDFDKNGKLDLYMGGSDLKLYLWELPTIDSDSAVVWNGFLNDPQNSGILPFHAKSAAPPSGPPLPTQFRLAQNYPNPFNATTAIEFDLSDPADARLEIFNALGQRVNTLVSSQLPAGFYHYEWDSTNPKGEQVASGVYFYRLTFGDSHQTRAMVLLK